jgi:hypothetical protein
MVIVVALLLLATGGPVNAPPADPRSTAMASMRSLIGTWHCRMQVTKGSEFEGAMTIAPALSGSWMRADIHESAVGRKLSSSSTYYWTYDRLTRMWGLYTFDNIGGFGNYGATWWMGRSIEWRGTLFAGHTYRSDFEWTKVSPTQFEIREHSTWSTDLGDNRAILVSVTTCSKTN